MIKFLGSKRLLIPHILEFAAELEGVRSMCDLFAGTTRVGQAFKRQGIHVHANDLTAYSHNLAQTYIGTDSTCILLAELQDSIDRLNALPGVNGYFTRSFAVDSAYFQPENARKIDAIRSAINGEPDHFRPILITALMLAADRVDSTTGLQMAYLKNWSPRSHNPIFLKVPDLLPGQGVATREDAITLAPHVDADLVYLDPPYNQHSYLGNYHVWETLVLNDSPHTYGIANKRIDCRERKSPFNSRRLAREALETVIHGLKSRYIILSFSDEGYLKRDALESILSAWGEFHCHAVPFKRYVGAKIGIHNQKGERVGKVGSLHNQEFLFVARRRG